MHGALNPYMQLSCSAVEHHGPVLIKQATLIVLVHCQRSSAKYILHVG